MYEGLSKNDTLLYDIVGGSDGKRRVERYGTINDRSIRYV